MQDRRRHLMWWFKCWASLLATTALVLSAALVESTVPAGASRSTGGWMNHSVHIVGSPIVVDHMVIVLDVTATHELAVSGVDPTNRSFAWSLPYSASLITPGVAFTPIAVGDT